jgi:hypothetical protein
MLHDKIVVLSNILFHLGRATPAALGERTEVICIAVSIGEQLVSTLAISHSVRMWICKL